MKEDKVNFQSPKSLTAIVHVRFHYKEEQGKEASDSEIAMMGRVLDHASELPKSQQEILAKFVEYLEKLRKG